MDEDEDLNLILTTEERQFTGELSRGDITIPVVFYAYVCVDGELALRFEPFDQDSNSRELERRWLSDNVRVGLHTLRGVADDGTRFETTELVISSFNKRWDANGPRTFRPDAKYQRARFLVPVASTDRPALRLWVKGFECYPEVRATCSLGEVVMWGSARLAEPDVITGGIEITASEAIDNVDEWRSQGEALLWHVRSIMSFGASVTLRSPLSETRIDGGVEILCRSQTRQSRPSLQSFDKLNLQPAFDAAVRTFFQPSAVKGLGIAIEWMALDSTYNEIRLISAMTALEHLLDVNLDEADALIMSKESFSPFRKAVAKALPDIKGDAFSAAQLADIRAKLGELNRRTLRRKLEILVAKWNVPLDDIDGRRLQAALGARNTVIHTGRHEKTQETDPDLWDHVTVVRELVVRIMLTALDFKGEYVTYLDGARRTQFPPTAPG